MTEKSEFHGNVGQVVIGNVKLPATLNNVVHVNIPADNFKPLTMLQRARIAQKVKDVVAISGMEQQEVYRELLTDFGAESMDVFPGDMYKEAATYLDGLLAEFKAQSGTSNGARNDAAQCKMCRQHAIEIRRGNRKFTVLFMLMALLIASQAWFLLHAEAPKTEQMAQPLRPSDERCHHDSMTYSIGSMAKMADGTVRVCTDAPADAPSFWAADNKRALHIEK